MAETNNTARRELLRKVQAADFYAYDLHLYLNTHPDCVRALNLFTKAVAEGAALRTEYENLYGPLTPAASSDVPPWQWSENPWTWERS